MNPKLKNLVKMRLITYIVRPYHRQIPMELIIIKGLLKQVVSTTKSTSTYAVTKFFILLLGVFLSVTSRSQCTDRYIDRHFNSIQVFRDVVYSKNAPSLVTAGLASETIVDKDLVMDIFIPPVTDTVDKRPAIIFSHGGGFVNILFMSSTLLVGSIDNDDVQAIADSFAHRGYVTAVIEYRVGFNPLSPQSLVRAVWRATQDISAAGRFLRKNHVWLGIDPNKIFASGSSAGAFGTIHSAYIDHNERPAETKELVPFFMRDLGPLHSRPIVSLTGTNPFVGSNVLGNDVDSIPLAIAGYWGAVGNTDWLIQGNNKAPMILFHGTADPIVDYKCERPFSSLILTADPVCGTYIMDSVLSANNQLHEAYYAAGEGHEYWGALNGEWLPSGPNAYFYDIIDKTAHFFYSFMQPSPPIIVGPDSIQQGQVYTYSITNALASDQFCWDVTGGTITQFGSNSIDVFSTSTTDLIITAQRIDPSDIKSDTSQFISYSTQQVSVRSVHKNELNIFPNPTYETIYVEGITNKTDLSFSIYNALGQHLESGLYNDGIDVKKLPSGIYQLVFFTGQTYTVHSLIKKD